MIRKCKFCSVEFGYTNLKQIFCSSKCRSRILYYENPVKYRNKQKELRQFQKDANQNYYIWYMIKTRAKRKNISFDIEVEDIIVPNECPILKIPLHYECRENTPSMDRIDNSKGYIKGNIQIVSYKANTMKNSASPKELTEFAKWILDNFTDEEEWIKENMEYMDYADSTDI